MSSSFYNTRAARTVEELVKLEERVREDKVREDRVREDRVR